MGSAGGVRLVLNLAVSLDLFLSHSRRNAGEDRGAVRDYGGEKRVKREGKEGRGRERKGRLEGHIQSVAPQLCRSQSREGGPVT